MTAAMTAKKTNANAAVGNSGVVLVVVEVAVVEAAALTTTVPAIQLWYAHE
jgi:hypothetical protein